MKTSRSYYAVRREGINLLPLRWEDLLAEQFGSGNKRSLRIVQCHLGDLLPSVDVTGKKKPCLWDGKAEESGTVSIFHSCTWGGEKKVVPDDKAVLAKSLLTAAVGKEMTIRVRNRGAGTRLKATFHLWQCEQEQVIAPSPRPQFPHLYDGVPSSLPYVLATALLGPRADGRAGGNVQ